MFAFYKFDLIPEERFKNTSNPSQYTIRFKELTKKSFFLVNDRLYFIKDNNTERLDFKDKEKVILKKIPFIYEVLPLLSEVHDKHGHISYKTLSKKFLESDYYLDGIEIITEAYSKECPQC